ncbi:hypothetical protein Tco_1282867 [Tanacetum coccineum]
MSPLLMHLGAYEAFWNYSNATKQLWLMVARCWMERMEEISYGGYMRRTCGLYLAMTKVIRDVEALCMCAGENSAASIPPGTPTSLAVEDKENSLAEKAIVVRGGYIGMEVVDAVVG